jgi:Glycosyl transferases group 1
LSRTSRTILFAWRRYPPPFLIGGAEVSQALLAEQLVQAGWNVVYVGSHEPPWGGPSLLNDFLEQLHSWSIRVDRDPHSETLAYSWRGVRCISTPQTAVETRLRQIADENCAAIITSQEGSAHLAQIAARLTSVIGWIHSVSDTGQEVLRAGPSYALLTSRFVQSRVVLSRRTKPVLFYPPFANPTRRPGARTCDVLVVNPVPAKGGSLIRALATLRPDRTFTLVEGWWDTRADFEDLPNVAYVPRTHEMDNLYATHRLLLVPSVVEDAFPRVIVEGALNGLPTIGSAVGGVGEAIGPGGSIINSRSPSDWGAAIDSVSNPELLAHYGHAAHQHAQQFVRDCAHELSQAGVIQR